MSRFSGTTTLVGLNVRRDKIVLPACLLAFAGVAAGSAGATIGVYPDGASRVQGAELINSTPALVAMYGPIYDVGSIGAISMFKLIGMGTAMVALFALLMVIRHTRADEELGRHELLAAGVLGRYAMLAAALVVVAASSVAIGVLTAAALIATGLPTVGSFAFGAAWAVTGLAFAGVGAVAAQLTASARAARGLAVGALGVVFLLRAAGDTAGADGPTWLTWLSPLGWAQQIRPFAGDRWWVAALPLIFAAVTLIVATGLVRRRDLGAGMLPQRPGPRQAGVLLTGPLTLAWRLQRTALIGWLAAFALLGLVVGQILSSIDEMLGTPVARELILQLGGVAEVKDAFLGIELSFVAVFASAYGIASTLRLAGEESAGRGELVLSRPVGRLRWMVSHLSVALAGTAALMLVAGLSIGISHAIQVADAAVVGRDLTAAVVRLPAVWVLVGVTVALYGLARWAAPLAWGVLVATFLASELGPLVDLPAWVRDLSPFTHVPNLPGGELTMAPLLALLGVAAALIAFGLGAFRRRDLAVG